MPKQILTIDDDPVIQGLLRGILDKAGHQVTSALNGQEGLEALHNSKPDLIMLDVEMPVMDGYAFYKTIKNDDRWDTIPVLVLTSRTKMEDSFLAVGVDGFLTKPFNTEILLQSVERLMEGGRILEVPKLKKIYDDASKNNDDGIAGKNILLVGAALEVKKYLSKHLSSKGFYVEAVNETEEFIAKAASLKPVVILCDVEVNNVSAYELITAFKKISDLDSKFLVYAYSRKSVAAFSQDSQYYYTHYLDKEFAQDPNPPRYLGAFNKEMISDELFKAVNRYLKTP